MKGRHEFMQVLTARTDLGIEFIEGWQLTRIAIAILLPVLAVLRVLRILPSLLLATRVPPGVIHIAGSGTASISVGVDGSGVSTSIELELAKAPESSVRSPSSSPSASAPDSAGPNDAGVPGS